VVEIGERVLRELYNGDVEKIDFYVVAFVFDYLMMLDLLLPLLDATLNLICFTLLALLTHAAPDR